jgi:hypothetical protein
MSKEIASYLSILLMVFTASNYALADFSEKQTRYLSYYDITSYFKSLEVYDNDCYQKKESNIVVFGYSSPVTGRPISANPNFDFLNSYLSCLKISEFENYLNKNIDSELLKKLGSIQYSIDSKDEKVVDQVIDELILKLIGPEVVLVSYGLIASQEELKNLLKNSAKEIVIKENNTTVRNYLKSVFTLIHLRDEFLSY